jgi:hypothetical protein
MNEVEAKPKKSPMKWIVIGVVIGIVIVASFILLLNPLSRIINPPRPEIVSKYGHDGFQGLNYVIYVDVTVRNNGGDGWIKAFAEVSGAGKYEKQEERVYLRNGETEDLNFVFDVSVWGVLFSSITYRVWAVAD